MSSADHNLDGLSVERQYETTFGCFDREKNTSGSNNIGKNYCFKLQYASVHHDDFNREIRKTSSWWFSGNNLQQWQFKKYLGRWKTDSNEIL